jgi:hypothetical protein
VQAPRGAIQQSHAEARFHRRERAAHHCGGHAQFAGGGREAARLDYLREHLHAVNDITHIVATDAKDFCDSPLFYTELQSRIFAASQ